MGPFEVINGLLTLEQNDRSMEIFFKDNGIESVMLYGLGTVGFRVYEALKRTTVRVVCGIDQAADEMEVEGLSLIRREKLGSLKQKADLIIVTPMDHYWEIREALEQLTDMDIISIGEIVEYCLAGNCVRTVRYTSLPGKAPETYCQIMVSSPSRRLEDKVIAITGATSGIGLATARKAAEESASVILLGRDEERLKKEAEEINAIWMKCDITNVNYESFFLELEQKSGGRKITAFVNNAGIYVDEPVGKYSSEQIERVLDTNLKSSFLLLQSYIAYCMAYTIQGNTVVTASNRGLFGDTGPYGVSKAGMINAVLGFARETVCDGIRVNAVCPGMTNSRINHIDKYGNLYTKSARGKRVLLAEEIAEVICWLLSDCSSCITGAIIPCDMGDYLR